MGKLMKTSIGNSTRIRIPREMLEKSGLEDEVELKATLSEIQITQAKNKNGGVKPWAAASEASFAKDWLRPDEDIAWADYQSEMYPGTVSVF
jgi:antitoxin component of MazEF toxin-antitoxin module